MNTHIYKLFYSINYWHTLNLYLVPICIYVFHKMVKMNTVGIFVTLGLQLDKHIVCICSYTHFIFNKNNAICITVHFILGYVVRRLVIIIIIIIIIQPSTKKDKNCG